MEHFRQDPAAGGPRFCPHAVRGLNLGMFRLALRSEMMRLPSAEVICCCLHHSRPKAEHLLLVHSQHSPATYLAWSNEPSFPCLSPLSCHTREFQRESHFAFSVSNVQCVFVMSEKTLKSSYFHYSSIFKAIP